MSRRNHAKNRPQARRQQRGGLPPLKRKPSLRVPLEEMVIPKGKCFLRSRHGKLRFSETEAQKALDQARRSREAKGLTAYAEERAYECDEPGGCGDWHLTSRKAYQPRAS